ncbi:hypothetical protein BOO86_13050 [Mycobacterium sp. CBMA 234]|uniref:hypothetical protein n=1 Tax=Mycolicibacterium sp. CBMA 234 TaxID=1918495 RepID=UPI0012DE07B8|nr:hypothetical protein [Mycolicibacterium sp. CBMA 234]MUL65399.1 hypothetical protein [Mycolicibacterium sp. CBMA 234]
MAAWKPVGAGAAAALWADDVVAVTTPALGAAVGVVADSGVTATATTLVGAATAAAGVRVGGAVATSWCRGEWVSAAGTGWVDGPALVGVCFERCALGSDVRGVAVGVPAPASSVVLVVLVVCAESAVVGFFDGLLGFTPSGFFVAAVAGLGALRFEFVLDESSADATPMALAADATSPMPTAPAPNQCA